MVRLVQQACSFTLIVLAGSCLLAEEALGCLVVGQQAG